MTRILIVEADPVAAEAAAMICKAARCAVSLAADAVEAMMLLQALPFDLVIVGARLPRKDGAALVAAIRQADAPYAALPVVGVAGALGDPAIEALRAAGADAVVTRPFRRDELAKAVARLLARGPARVTLFRPSPDPRGARRPGA